MEKRYDIDVEQDVMKGRITTLIVAFGNYTDDHNIDRNDSNNPVMVKYLEAIDLDINIYSMRTYNELDAVEQKINELWGYLDAL